MDKHLNIIKEKLTEYSINSICDLYYYLCASDVFDDFNKINVNNITNLKIQRDDADILIDLCKYYPNYVKQLGDLEIIDKKNNRFIMHNYT